MILVFNASPVIVLAKAGLLEPFAKLGDPSIVPQMVVEEILKANDPLDPACAMFRAPQSLMEVIPAAPMSEWIAGWDLGAGEGAVISIASARGAVAVLDDLAARRCAQAHGLAMTGTLGLVLLAKKRGVIERVGPALDAVVDAGLYISPRVLAEVRAKAGE